MLEQQPYDELRIFLARRGETTATIRTVFHDVEMQASGVSLPMRREEAEQTLSGAQRMAQDYAVRKGVSTDLDAIGSLGRALYMSLFDGEREAVYRRAQSAAAAEGRALWLNLVMADSTVAGLPWEFLHDGREFIALSARSPLVRSVVAKGDATTPPPAALTKIRVAEIQSPNAPLDREKLIHELASRLTDRFPSVALEHRRIESIQDLASLASEDDGEILLISGESVELRPGRQGLLARDGAFWPAEQVGEVLGPWRRLRLLGLLPNFSDLLAFELANLLSVPMVMGIRNAMREDAAMAVVKELGARLFAGKPAIEAITRCRKRTDLDLQRGRDWGLTVFYVAAPDAPLFSSAEGTLEYMGTAAAWPLSSSDQAATSQPGDTPEQERLRTLIQVTEMNLNALKRRLADYRGEPPSDLLKRTQETELKLQSLQQDLEHTV